MHGEQSSGSLQWLTVLLSDRHLYVDGLIHTAINERMQEACNRVRVVVSTSSQLITSTRCSASRMGLREEETRGRMAHRVGTHRRPSLSLDRQFEASKAWLAEVFENV